MSIKLKYFLICINTLYKVIILYAKKIPKYYIIFDFLEILLNRSLTECVFLIKNLA